MIIDKLIDLIASFLGWLSSALPAHHLEFVGIAPAFESFFALNYFLPLVELAAIVLGVISFSPVMLATKVAFWIVAFIRGGNSTA